MLHKSFKPAKCKTALNLAKSRIKLMRNKKEIQMRQLRRELAQLLQNNQDQTARIRVEHVVREEKMLAAYEMIEIYCELVVARLPIIESQKHCPLDLKEAITSLIFAAPRCGDLPELQDVRKHFTAKYGKEFVAAAVELRPACGVSRAIVEKLSVKAPDGPTKVKILKGIAEEHNIQWEPNWFKDEDLVFSSETSNTSHTEKSNMIQMEPLNVPIADDLEEKHGQDMARSQTSARSNALANNNEIAPSSTSRPDARPLGNVSERMSSGHSSGSVENAFPVGRQNWNMEFKDAAAAAEAAAESAERASMAARAAAEFSMRSNITSDSSPRPVPSSVHVQSDDDRHYAGAALSSKHVQEDVIRSSFNQRIPRMQGNHGGVEVQGDMNKGPYRKNSNEVYSQSKVEYETQEELRDSRSSSYRVNQGSRRQFRDSVSTLGTSKGEHDDLGSSNFQDYGSEAAENPFHEGNVESKAHPTSFQSQSSGFEDEYGVFSNLNNHADNNDSDGRFGAFNQVISGKDHWHMGTSSKSSFNDGLQDHIFRDHVERPSMLESEEKKYRFDSASDVFGGTKFGEMVVDEQVSHIAAGAVFDDSGSDDDEPIIESAPLARYGFPSGKPSPQHSSLHEDNPHFEPDLSESFRESPIYSKLIEPVTIYDSDGTSSGSEKELPIEKDPGIKSYDTRKSDTSSKMISGLNRSSFVEKGDPLELQDSVPEFDDDTQHNLERGVGLNLGSLPGGRRNRPNRRESYGRGGLGDASSPLGDASSPSYISNAVESDEFGTSERISPFFKSQMSSSQMEDKQVSTKMSRHYSPGDDFEVVNTPKHVISTQTPYSAIIPENVTRTKDPTGYFDSDESASEEDVRRPVTGKPSMGAGFSRRTKVSAQTVVGSSQPISSTNQTETSVRDSSRSYADASPQQQIKTRDSSLSRGRQPSSYGEETSEPRSEIKASRGNKSFSPSVADKKVTLSKVDETQTSSGSSGKAPSRENSSKKPGHVHPKLPDSDTFAAHFQSLWNNRQ